MPVSYITHNGKEILYVDLRESKSEARSLELLEQTKDEYMKATKKLLVLVDTTGAFVNPTVSNRMKEYGKTYFKGKAEKRAFVGIQGAKKIIVRAYMAMIGGDLKLFDDVDSAKDYLAS